MKRTSLSSAIMRCCNYGGNGLCVGRESEEGKSEVRKELAVGNVSAFNV